MLKCLKFLSLASPPLGCAAVDRAALGLNSRTLAIHTADFLCVIDDSGPVPKVIVANHSSYLDVVLMMSTYAAAFLAKVCE